MGESPKELSLVDLFDMQEGSQEAAELLKFLKDKKDIAPVTLEEIAAPIVLAEKRTGYVQRLACEIELPEAMKEKVARYTKYPGPRD